MSTDAYLSELADRVAYLAEVASVPAELVDDPDGAGRLALIDELERTIAELRFAAVISQPD